MVARARIIRIGNSRGIRVPKAMLDQAKLPEEVELCAEPGQLLVRPVRRPREGWGDAAKTMRERNDDGLLGPSVKNRFDEQEWQWQ